MRCRTRVAVSGLAFHLGSVLLTAPRRPPKRSYSPGHVLEGGEAWHLSVHPGHALLRDGIPPLLGLSPVGQRHFHCFIQGNRRPRAQAQVALPTADGEALRLPLVAPGVYPQGQPVAATIGSRLRCPLHPTGCECLGLDAWHGFSSLLVFLRMYTGDGKRSNGKGQTAGDTISVSASIH